jgi:hypothetical protein
MRRRTPPRATNVLAMSDSNKKALVVGEEDQKRRQWGLEYQCYDDIHWAMDQRSLVLPLELNCYLVARNLDSQRPVTTSELLPLVEEIVKEMSDDQTEMFVSKVVETARYKCRSHSKLCGCEGAIFIDARPRGN